MAASIIDQWMQQVAGLLDREGLGNERLGADLQRNLRAMTQAWLRNLDVVSREEFEAQRVVLARTRARLESLEQQIAELERSAAAETVASETAPPEKPAGR